MQTLFHVFLSEDNRWGQSCPKILGWLAFLTISGELSSKLCGEFFVHSKQDAVYETIATRVCIHLGQFVVSMKPWILLE